MSAEYSARIYIKLKESVLDPQGQAVTHALHNLGYDELKEVRVGKFVELKLLASDEKMATDRVTEYCDKLLANPVIESYQFDLTILTS